ncbi:MAG: putative 2OG-Fe(II) oxygenase [Pseudomonadota bacterium]
MADIVPFFAVPFAFARHPDPASLNARLRALFLERSSGGATYANSRPITQRNAAVFESRFDLFRWPDEPVQELKEFCWSELLRVVCDLNGYDAAFRAQLLIYNDAWFHVTRRGGFFGLHNHPNATWSGVYCVDPGSSGAEKRDSGALTFVSPMLAAHMHVDAGNARFSGGFASGLRSLRMEAGHLVLFPSGVLHDVKPFEGDGERITVAFNCWFGTKETL